MDETDLERRRTVAINACDRVLSHGRQLTMRERLAALAGSGYDLDAAPDIYGDGVVRTLEQRVASLLGKPDAAFFPTGTMAQQVALRCWAARTGNPVVGLHSLAHPELHERQALTAVAGLRTIHLTTEPRPPTAAEIRDADEPFGVLTAHCGQPASRPPQPASRPPQPAARAPACQLRS